MKSQGFEKCLTFGKNELIEFLGSREMTVLILREILKSRGLTKFLTLRKEGLVMLLVNDIECEPPIRVVRGQRAAS